MIRHWICRSSTSTAAAAFAIATSASSNPRDEPPVEKSTNRKDSVVSSPATMRVLNVLRFVDGFLPPYTSLNTFNNFTFCFNSLNRHWVSKHVQDFEQDSKLRSQTIAFLDDITCSPNLLPGEHRAASQLLRLLCREEYENNQIHLEKLLKPSKVN